MFYSQPDLFIIKNKHSFDDIREQRTNNESKDKDEENKTSS